MDNAGGLRRDLAVGVDMSHHIMAHFLFPSRRTFVINIGDVRFQLGDLFCRNWKAQLHFRLCQRDPELPPGLNAGIHGEQLQHILRGIAGT